MPLSLHRAERADALVAGLARLLAASPADAFTPDVVAVPSKGVERWIAQSLSAALGAQPGRGDGICANVVFPSPRRLVREAVAAGSGVPADEDEWAEHRLPWPLLEVVDGCAGEDWCVTLGRHLGLAEGGVDQGRRMAVAQKLAGLFTSYGAQRPSMLRDWAEGRDTDGYGSALPSDHMWQAELWRRVRRRIGAASPSERMAEACERLRAEPALIDLPERLSLFGPTRMTTEQLQVVDALAAHRDVHLWLPHPSPDLWRRVAEAAGAGGTLPRRREDPTVDVPRHPLLRSLARDARELELRVLANTVPDLDEHLAAQPGPGGLPAVAARPGSLLTVLQRDLLADRPPAGDHRCDPDDRSVEVHACHGRQRQVEVLREVLLGLLEDDPTLELRDIIVMCPDIEAYTPLVKATFGLMGYDDSEQGEVHPGHRLTVRLADRSLRQTNPVLGVASRLLQLVDSRLTVAEVLDLAATPPVRRRFGFDEEALERIGDWVRRSGVRWGLDADARHRYGLDRIRQNTWQAGLDRLMVGVAMDEDELRTLGLALPLDDVDSSEIDLAGRLAELLDRLAEAVATLTREQPLTQWVAALTAALESLVDVGPADEWQLSQARWQLADALTSAGGHGDRALRLPDVRTLLAERLRGRPTRANFRTGHLTVCTMVPMRSVPHRVVCLLGLDDGAFPRGSRIDGDYILARAPRVWERDPRSEDRQLLLDAILAAKERLVVVYTGADERTGVERPPAVPVGELLDVLDRTAKRSGAPVRDHVLVRHPLQPFDARNFVPGELAGRSSFSFDAAAYDGTVALLGGRTSHGGFLEKPLPDPEPSPVVELDSLVRFLEHPVQQFLRQRLGLSTTEEQDEPAEGIPVSPEPLEQWGIGNRLLEAALSGAPLDRAARAEWLRGELPPGRLGSDVLAPLVDTVVELVDRSSGLRRGEATSLDVAVTLPDGTTLVGTVPGVYDDCVVRVVYSRLGAKHRLRAWVQLLALAAQWPDRSWQARTVGRGGARKGVALSHLTGVGGEAARAHLAVLVATYRAGLREPLPMPPKTACAYAERRHTHVAPGPAVAHAGKQWRTGSGSNERGEFSDADHQRVWGDVALSELLAARPDEGDLGDLLEVSGRELSDIEAENEPHRFGQLARRVWGPLLAAEQVFES